MGLKMKVRCRNSSEDAGSHLTLSSRPRFMYSKRSPTADFTDAEKTMKGFFHASDASEHLYRTTDQQVVKLSDDLHI